MHAGPSTQSIRQAIVRTGRIAAALALALALSSCTENQPESTPGPTPPPLLTEPIGIQITRAEPTLGGTAFRVLLDFERPSDLAFVVAPPSAGGGPARDEGRAHTGRSSLRLERGGEFALKPSSVLSGAFPAKWTIAGAYFSPAPSASKQVARVTVAYRTAASPKPLLQRTVELRGGAGAWTPVMIDLTALPPAASSDGALITFNVDAPAAVFCDDVLVIDNARTLESPAAGSSPDPGWTIQQGGFAITVDRPNRFRVTLKTPESAADGWTAQEACDRRVRFVSVAGKTWTIYSDGRQYKDGAFSSLINIGDTAAIFARQHDSPAELTVADEFGRVDRDTPGDRNNDGYNEQRGAYELMAKGPRFEVTIKPTATPLVRPVLEITGLPKGNVLVTVEGQLIPKTTRLSTGTLLVELPLALERPTTMNVSVK